METSNDGLTRLMNAVVTLVADAQRGMARSIDVNRIAVLRLAATEPGVTPGEVSRRLRLPPSSVTRHAQVLEEAGQLALRRNPHDARSAVLAATATGRAELAAIDQVGLEIYAGVVADWTPEEIEQFTGLVERFTAAWAERGEQQKKRRRRVSRWQRDDDVPEESCDDRPEPAPRPAPGDAGRPRGGRRARGRTGTDRPAR